MSFAKEEKEVWSTECTLKDFTNKGLALLRCDPGKEEEGGCLKTNVQGKIPPGLGCLIHSCLGQEQSLQWVFFSNGEGVSALSLGNRDGPVGSQPGGKADGDKIK